MSGLTKEDLRDADVVDAVELASPGTTTYITGATVVSTTAATKRIVFSGIDLVHDVDERAEPKDKVTLAGTTGADGTYTIANVIDSVTVDVEETIVDSTGGTATFRHPPGSSKVGFDPTGLIYLTKTNVQEALEEVDANISGGPSSGITEAQHDALDDMVHWLAETNYQEITRSGGKVINVTNWTNSGKTVKVREMIITRSAGKVSQLDFIQYDGSGVEKQRMTGVITRSAGKIASVQWTETGS
jgi:hypothetical protein